MSNDKKASEGSKINLKHIVLNTIGIILCVILLPILIFNCILIVKGLINPNEVPSIGNYAPLIVLTDSMDDTIKSGDLIICEKVEASEIVVNDVISFFDPEGNGSSVVTHRVIKIETDDETGETVFRTQGDNNDIFDRVPVPAENLVGKWTGVRIGLLGHVILFTQTPLGLLICIFVPIGVVVLYQVLKRKQSDKAKQNDINTLKAELEALKQAQQTPQENLTEGAKESANKRVQGENTPPETPSNGEKE